MSIPFASNKLENELEFDSIEEIRLRVARTIKDFHQVCEQHRFSESKQLIDFDDLLGALSSSNFSNNSNSNSNIVKKIGGSSTKTNTYLDLAVREAFENASKEFENLTRPVEQAVSVESKSRRTPSSATASTSTAATSTVATSFDCSRNILNDLDQEKEQCAKNLVLLKQIENSENVDQFELIARDQYALLENSVHFAQFDKFDKFIQDESAKAQIEKKQQAQQAQMFHQAQQAQMFQQAQMAQMFQQAQQAHQAQMFQQAQQAQQAQMNHQAQQREQMVYQLQQTWIQKAQLLQQAQQAQLLQQAKGQEGPNAKRARNKYFREYSGKL